MTEQPDPRFLEHLEWQVRTALRRKERFAMPAGPARWAAVRSVGLVVLSIVLGGAGVLAAERWQGSRVRDLLVERAGLQRMLAADRWKDSERHAEEVRAQHDRGIVSADEVGVATRQLVDAQLAHARALLDLEEVETSGREVSDALFAPLVGGRDFVTERLELERERLRGTLAILSGGLDRIRELAAVGVVSRMEVEAHESVLRELEADLQAVQSRLQLRGQFTRGEIDGREVELLGLQVLAEARVQQARARLQVAQSEQERTRALQDVGRLPRPSGPDRLEAAKGELRLAELELSLLLELLSGR